MTIDLIVVVTVHNRSRMTETILRQARAQADALSLKSRAVVVDDGSTDDTTQVVQAAHGEWVELERAEGDLFWSAGMARGMLTAMSFAPRYILWLNNDVILDDDALDRALKAADRWRATILVGATRSQIDGSITYSGQRRASRRPGHFRQVNPSSTSLLPLDAMNGNFVLIPAEVYRIVGTVNDRYKHSYGDLDYAIRARRAGFDVLLLSGTVGICEQNPTTGTWMDSAVARTRRIRDLFGPKGYDLLSQVRFTRLQVPHTWPAFVLVFYAKRVFKIVTKQPGS